MKRPEKIIARRKRYNELLKLHIGKSNEQIVEDRLFEAQRYIYDIAMKVLGLQVKA